MKKGSSASPVMRAKLSAAHKAYWAKATPEMRAALSRRSSESGKRHWATLTPRERHLRGRAHTLNRGSGKRARPFGTPECNYEERARIRLAAGVFERYGLLPEDEARLFERQHGRCALCFTSLVVSSQKKNKLYHIDHDHSTGRVRGLLCPLCNLRAAPALERFGEIGVAYTVTTPVDLYLQAHAGIAN